MSRSVVIDTNVLVALIDHRDKWHDHVLKIFRAFKNKEATFIYFDCVINESISILARRSEEQKRSQQFPQLLNSLVAKVPKERITWISNNIEESYTDILRIVSEYEGILNFHDAMIALHCRNAGIESIISFDRDFDCLPSLRRISKPGEVEALWT